MQLDDDPQNQTTTDQNSLIGPFVNRAANALYDKVVSALKSITPHAKILANLTNNRYFVPEKVVAEMLFDRDHARLPSTNWIKYTMGDGHYNEDTHVFDVTRGRATKKLKIPYKEEINFIKFPHAKISVVGGKRGMARPAQYVMDKDLMALTNDIAHQFIGEKSKTFNGDILRIKSLTKKVESGSWEVELQSARYFDQVRTNLTLDSQVYLNQEGGKVPTSLRKMDMNAEQNLKPLGESLLVNSLGVSAVCYYKGHGQTKHFFMKRRRSSDGVFENMLATTSGVVEPPLPPDIIKEIRELQERDKNDSDSSRKHENEKDQKARVEKELKLREQSKWPHQMEKIKDLVSYAKSEMLRELSRETGITENLINHIQPLAFVRELTRGGKPQFLFLIEIKKFSKKDFGKIFRASAEGLEEFHDERFESWAACRSPLSPEFMANLLYAFEYFQSIEDAKSSAIRLD